MDNFGSISLLKKKFKSYLNDNAIMDLKINNAPQQIMFCIVLIAEKLLLKCVEKEQPEKNNEGIYNVKEQILRVILYDYGFFEKYNKQYNKLINYTPFINMNKFYSSFEMTHGNKLLICKETKNLLNYIVCCIQNEMIMLCCSILNYAGKKTFNTELIILSVSHVIQNDELIGLIKLKLDCINKLNENHETQDSKQVENKQEENEEE
jgi:hypothetical protein